MIELVFELFLQLFVEIFGDVLLHLLSSGARRTHNAILTFLGYLLAGVAVGFLTIFIFPLHFIDDPDLQLVNLLLTPVAIAALMFWIGRIRMRREKRVVRLESFFYAYVLAMSIATVRYLVAD